MDCTVGGCWCAEVTVGEQVVFGNFRRLRADYNLWWHAIKDCLTNTLMTPRYSCSAMQLDMRIYFMW